mgnify:FL=1
MAERCAQSGRKWWEDELRQAAEKAGEGEDFVGRALDQGASLLEVFWSVVPWDHQVEPADWAKDGHRRWHKAEAHAQRFLTLANLLQPEVLSLKPNAGALYADLNEQAELLVNAAKQERYAGRALRDEGGLKCSVCGEREVLGGSDFWIQRTEGFEKRNDKGYLTDNEQLCGICTAKRRFDLGELKDTPLGRQPSTGEVAASAFKLAVIEACKSEGEAPQGRKKLRDALRDFVEAAKKAAELGQVDKGDLRVYCSPLVELAALEDGDLKDFAHIDGQWLLPFPREESEERRPEELL